MDSVASIIVDIHGERKILLDDQIFHVHEHEEREWK